MNFYERMKLINYIRKQNFNGACWICQKCDIGNTIQLGKHLKEQETPFKVMQLNTLNRTLECIPDASVWNTEENLVPMFGNDHLLWLLESYLEEQEKGTDEAEDVPGKGIKILIDESKGAFVEGVSHFTNFLCGSGYC